MAFFVVISGSSSPAGLEQRLASEYPEHYYKINDKTWMLSTRGETSQGVSSRVGFNGSGGQGKGPNAPGLVFSVDTYWGRFSGNLWEWMRLEDESQNG